MEDELKDLDWDLDGSHSTEPPENIKLNGYPQGSAPPTEHFNWIWRTIDRWIKKIASDVDGKEPSFLKKTAFNLDKVDDPEAENVDSSFLVATGKALKKVWDKAVNTLVETVTNKNAILNNAEQIENLSNYVSDEFVLFDGLFGTVGIIELSDNWDNYEKLLFISYSPSSGSGKHIVIYTKYAIASDSTKSNNKDELALGTYNEGCLRDTNRNEIYITLSSAYITKIIGIGKIQ